MDLDKEFAADVEPDEDVDIEGREKPVGQTASADSNADAKTKSVTSPVERSKSRSPSAPSLTT